jgi:hypothetical protein
MAGGVLAGIVLGVTTGVAVFSVPSAGTSFLSLGLVDLRSGELLWVSADYKGGGINLRNEKDLSTVLTQLFASYPGIAKPVAKPAEQQPAAKQPVGRAGQ